MHYGQGAVLGVVRALMANAGLRGPVASARFAAVRLSNDQILENATGVGAPPQTWPRSELVVDLLHKTVYAFATGMVADALAARHGPGPGQRHAALRPGRRSGVGPLPRGGVRVGCGAARCRGGPASYDRNRRSGTAAAIAAMPASFGWRWSPLS